MATEERIYGIDLGTTYSCISYVDENEAAIIIPNSQGQRTTPSAVYIENADNVVVGQVAKESADMEANRVVTMVKREMDNADKNWIRTIDGKDYSPTEISAFILRQLALDASKNLGQEVKKVVITVPAYFGTTGKEATRAAGSLAGLEVVGILEEPTAAAIAYGVGKDESKNILVYDLGGGTFDVTVIAVSTGKIRVICTDGDHHLGGKNWDDALVEHFITAFEAQEGPSNIRDDAEGMQNLALLAEKTKQTLTQRASLKQRIQYDGRSVTVEVSRDEFAAMTSSLLEQTINFTKDTLETAKAKGITTIDEIIMVGGSSRMPQVSDRLKQEFGIELKLFDPDEAVAKGAAVYARQKYIEKQLKDGLKDEGIPDKVIDDVIADPNSGAAESAVGALPPDKQAAINTMLGAARTQIIRITPKSYGVDAMVDGKNKLCNVLKKNTEVPCVAQDTFYTLQDDQRSVRFAMLENTSDESILELSEGREIGATTITGLPSGLRAGTEIEVSFTLNDDAVLHFYATCSGQEVRATLTLEGGLTEKEMEAAMEKVEALAQVAN